MNVRTRKRRVARTVVVAKAYGGPVVPVASLAAERSSSRKAIKNAERSHMSPSIVAKLQRMEPSPWKGAPAPAKSPADRPVHYLASNSERGPQKKQKTTGFKPNDKREPYSFPFSPQSPVEPRPVHRVRRDAPARKGQGRRLRTHIAWSPISPRAKTHRESQVG